MTTPIENKESLPLRYGSSMLANQAAIDWRTTSSVFFPNFCWPVKSESLCASRWKKWRQGPKSFCPLFPHLFQQTGANVCYWPSLKSQISANKNITQLIISKKKIPADGIKNYGCQQLTCLLSEFTLGTNSRTPSSCQSTETVYL